MLRSCSTARLLLLSRRCCLLSPLSAIRARSGHLPLSPRLTAGRASASSSPPLSPPSTSSATTRTTKTTTTMALGADPAASSAAPASAATPAPPASSAAAVRGLDPPLLWQHFLTLSALPRPSKREGAVVRWLRAFAEERKDSLGLELKEDKAGNVLIFRPGSGGGEDAEVVCVQGHIDMVTEKDAGVEHDFDKDPLLLKRSECGDWLTATGTTLGADNGIGVAAALALLDSPAGAKLPPLECLFTVDEETGLSGAFGLDGSMVRGVRLVNLDTEDWGDLFIGCAGGGDTQVVLPATKAESISEVDVAAGTRLRLSVRGLLGGHSGINIGDDRGNAVILAARLADAAATAAAKAKAQAQKAPSFLVATARGGDKRNALAREASIEAWIPYPHASEAAAAVVKAAREEGEAIKEEYGTLEKDLEVVVEASTAAGDDGKLSSSPPPTPLLPPLLDARTSDALLTLLLTLPHGVIKKSHAVAGLVETSTNLASVAPEFGKQGGGGGDGGSKAEISAFRISCSTRSSLMPALEAARRSIARVARGAGARVEQGEAYPGWAADPDAPLVALAREAVEGVTGRPAHVGAIHAGLECGLIKAIVGPTMRDAVSFGPTILGAHSPDERVDVRTVGPFFEAVRRLMERLADEKATRS